MKGVGLRRQQRQASHQSATPSNDAPVPVVFRVHTDSLSKAQFLFCPKNFNLANPITAPSTPASASSPGSHGDTDGTRDAVDTLVEAFVELRPFFPATVRSGSAGSPGGPLANPSFSSVASFGSLLRDGPPGSPFTLSSPTSGDATAGQPQRGLYRHPHHLLTSYGSTYDLVAAASAAHRGDSANPVLYTSASEANLGHTLHGAMGGATSGSFVGLSSSNALATSSFVDLYALSTYVSSTAERLENDRYSDHHHHHTSSAGAGGGGGGGGLGKRGDGGSGVGGGRGLTGSTGGGSASARGGGGGVSGTTGTGSPDFTGDGHTGGAPLLMHPCGSWICRAMAFNERETVHANGAISVNQALTGKCPLVNEIAKGKTMAKLVSYEAVRERFGLSHVELSFEHQYVSRSDMFLISEALRERILYEGEELFMCGFRLKANELLQTFHAVTATTTAASPTANTAANEREATSGGATGTLHGKPGPGSAAIPLSGAAATGGLPKRGSNTDVHGGSAGSSSGGAQATRRGLRQGTAGLPSPASKEDASQGAAAAGGATAAERADAPEKREIRVGCGLVTADTRINFRSLSPVHYIVIELAHEMWGTTLDGRIALTWALKKFMRELLWQQLPRRRASPLLRIVFTGRVHRAFAFSSESDIFHLLEIPQDTRDIDIAEEVERHCEALVERVVREVKEEAMRRLVLDENSGLWESCPPSAPSSTTRSDAPSKASVEEKKNAAADAARWRLQARIDAIHGLTPKDVFVYAKQSNTLEALSIILEQCTHHYIDRRLHSTGHCITVVTAGKGHYHTSNGLVQISCTRMHDLGLEKVHFACMGRPPLHATPLLEYTTEDDTLRAQYHLPYGGGPRDGHQQYFEVPEWALCFFYYPVLGSTSGETRFQLLSKADWLSRYTTMAGGTGVVDDGRGTGGGGVAPDGTTATAPAAIGAVRTTPPSSSQEPALTRSAQATSLGAGNRGDSSVYPRTAAFAVEAHSGGGPVTRSSPSSMVVGLVPDVGDDAAASLPANDTAADALSGVPAALINGQRVLLQGLGLSMCAPPTVVLPVQYDVMSAAVAAGSSMPGVARGDETSPWRPEGGLTAGRSASSVWTFRSDDWITGGGSADHLTAPGSQPVPTSADWPHTLEPRLFDESGTGSAPRTFSLPRSLEAYRRGEGPLCVSRSHDFKTTANPLLHASGSYHHARLSPTTSRPALRSGRLDGGGAASGPGRQAADATRGRRCTTPAAPRSPTAARWLVEGTWLSLHGLNSGAKAGVSASGVGAGAGGGGGLGLPSAHTNAGDALSLTERVVQYLERQETMSTSPPPQDASRVGRLPWLRAPVATLTEAAPCGLNILDSDVKGGYLLHQLTLSAHVLAVGCYWSPRVLMDDRLWATLMSCFSSRDDRAGRDEATGAAGPGGESAPPAAAAASGGAVNGVNVSDGTPSSAGGGEVSAASVAGLEAAPSFHCDFRPSDVFCRLYSGLTADGRTLLLATHTNDVTIRNPEELRFSLRPSLLTTTAPSAMCPEAVDALCRAYTDGDAQRALDGHHQRGAATAEGSSDTAADDVASPAPSHPQASPLSPTTAASPLGTDLAKTLFTGTRGTVTVGYVQLRDRLLFAVKPVDPLRSTTRAVEEAGDGEWVLPRSAASATTEAVFRRRWHYQHPDVSLEPPHIASWTRLCTCKMLPLYGIKPAYTREGFYTVPPHQYSLSDTTRAAERSKTLEFVLQRLQQQYQIVDDGGLASQWPRADPSPNMRVEMSIGHQMHTLKIGETTKTISVSRMLHRGMYSNAQVTHMLSYRYSLWNYLSDAFDAREVHMEAQVGEKNAYSWEDLDRWIQNRPDAFIPHSPDTWLRAREIAVALLPDDPAKPTPFDEFHNFIGYRFSVHLSTRGSAEWVSDDAPLRVSVPPLTSPEGAEYPEPPPLMEVVLTHDNPRALETRNRVDPHTGRTVAFEQPVEERFMLVDIDLHHWYNPHCAYILKVAWLGCAASIVADWHGSFIANAGRYRFRVVPITCYYQNPRTETLTARYDVRVPEQVESRVRRRLLRLLTNDTFRYYPDTPVMNRHCRLIHLSGLCYVVVPPSSTLIAQWYQNALVRQGTPQQQELFRQFRAAVELAKSDTTLNDDDERTS